MDDKTPRKWSLTNHKFLFYTCFWPEWFDSYLSNMITYHLNSRFLASNGRCSYRSSDLRSFALLVYSCNKTGTFTVAFYWFFCRFLFPRGINACLCNVNISDLYDMLHGTAGSVQMFLSTEFSSNHGLELTRIKRQNTEGNMICTYM